MPSATEPAASALRRFLRYVKPYWLLIVGATLCGVLKFTLPAAFAIALRFMTDRLVPQFGARARAHRPGLQGHRALSCAGSPDTCPRAGMRSTHVGTVQRPGGDAARRVRGVGRGHVLPQLLGAARRASRHARSAHRPVPAHPAPEPFVLPGAPVGRHRLAPDRRHRAGAEFRRRGHDQHLDGRGDVPVLPGAAAGHERAAHHRGAGGVPALHRLHAHLRRRRPSAPPSRCRRRWRSSPATCRSASAATRWSRASAPSSARCAASSPARAACTIW